MGGKNCTTGCLKGTETQQSQGFAQVMIVVPKMQQVEMFSDISFAPVESWFNGKPAVKLLWC